MFFIGGMAVMALIVFLGCASVKYSPVKPCFACANLLCAEKVRVLTRNPFTDVCLSLVKRERSYLWNSLFFFFFFNASVLSGMLLNKIQKIFKVIKSCQLGGWIKYVLVYNSSVSKISEVKKKKKKNTLHRIRETSFHINTLWSSFFHLENKN